MYKALTTAQDAIVLPENLTEEIVISWCSNRAFWRNLKTMFKNYFTGKELVQNIPYYKEKHEVLKLKFYEYLALYNLFNFGWTDVKKGLSSVVNEIKTPGEALVYILSEEAKLWTNNSSSNPETLARAWNAFTIDNMEKCNIYIKRLEKQTGKKISDQPPHLDFIDICLSLTQASKSESVRLAAKTYLFRIRERCDNTASKLRKMSKKSG